MFLLLCFLDEVSLLLPGLECKWRGLGSLQSVSWFQAILLPQLPDNWDYRRLPPHPANFCIFLLEMGFHHASQAGLELPTSGDPPASASQSAGITGMSPCMQPLLFNFERAMTYMYSH